MKDALFLVHPKAKDEGQQTIFNKIAYDILETPYTWEVELSVLGQKKFADETEKKQAFKNKWEELIFSNKLGYMATLRNLRNILEAGVSPEAMGKVCNDLSDERAVLNSKQLPFRFLAAYRELKKLIPLSALRLGCPGRSCSGKCPKHQRFRIQYLGTDCGRCFRFYAEAGFSKK